MKIKPELAKVLIVASAMVAASVLVSIFLCGCTIAPKTTEPAKVSPWAKANVIGHDLTGYTVGTDWIRVYHSLLRAYGDKLPINEQVPSDSMTGIEPLGPNFHVTFEVNKRMTDLLLSEKSNANP